MLNPLNIISKFIKSGNQKELDRIQKIVKEINLLESNVSKFEDKKFSDLFYVQLDSTAKKLNTFSQKIGKNIEDLEIDDLVLLVEQR